MFQFDPIGLLAVVAFVMCIGLAVVVHRVGMSGGPARSLSLLLAVEGITMISTGYIDLFVDPEVRALPSYAVWLTVEGYIHTAGDCLMLALYPPFLGLALRTPLVQPLTSVTARIVLAVAATILFLAVFLTPLEYGAVFLYASLVILFVFALVSSIHAWHLSQGAAKSRAAAFSAAFGFRDICWSYAYGGAIWMIWSQEYAVVETNASGAPYIVYALGTLIAVPLIAYGILRTQLFDIDLRLRWTVKQSTLAAAIVAVIFLVSEGAEQFLSEELGNVAGLLAAAVLVFFLAPLQNLSERFASMAMPNTTDTPEYIAYRKMQVYEEAVREALAEGGISRKERVLLERLRDSLGISEIDARAIDRDLAGEGTA